MRRRTSSDDEKPSPLKKIKTLGLSTIKSKYKDDRKKIDSGTISDEKDKAKKKLEKKYTKDQDKYESTMKSYYEALSEERQV